LLKNQKILVTTFTATGLQHAINSLPEQVKIQALPIDWWPISLWFINAQAFKLALIAETELWPEILYQAQKTAFPYSKSTRA